MDKTAQIPIRKYRVARLYGPGMPASTEEGYHVQILEKPAGQIGLVLVHCWNLGEADGPYPIGSDSHIPGEAADWVPTAHEIISEKIRPVLEAAREAGIAIFHLAQDGYAPKYPQYLEIAADPDLHPPEGITSFEGCVRPWKVHDVYRDQYGPDFPGAVWETHAELIDIAKPVRPLPNEAVYLNGWQLNGLCRRLDIDTLFFAGFMADLCLLNIPGALREMNSRFLYRCVVLHDCTTAYEFADTYEHQSMTRAAIRLMETDLGFSTSSSEFIEAMEALRGE
jgi:nicotinamidase-related amidase